WATDEPFSQQAARKWMPVDQYIGGIEHAILHLMYARFWTKAMRDIGLVHFSEPFTRLMNQGMILGEDNEKMSKSRGNVVNPDDLVAEYGAETVRLYLQFIGPWDQGGPWAPRGVDGVYRWLGRVWNLFLEPVADDAAPTDAVSVAELRRQSHATLKKVQEDTLAFRFNTAVAAMMEYSNFMTKAKRSPVYATPEWDEALNLFNLMLAPYAPHMAEELWHRRGGEGSVHRQAWPAVDETALTKETFELVVQVNGKLRGRVEAPVNATQDEAMALAKSVENVQVSLEGKTIVKVVFVPGRLLNVVVK
ncbi:MAG TPA: class I tRNA ligase family protein, partial [Deinococcales bacterium]|nr:class I tRNA ligase family protein [Deinococcales bacterium]